MLDRHDLVWLNLDAVKHAQYAGPVAIEPLSALSMLHRWVLGGYPLIVARQDEVPTGCLRVGLAEPASWGKRRLSFVVNVQGIQKHQQGPQLIDVVPHLPVDWQAGANALLALLRELNVPACVYGSSAIQALTGLPCITASSDLDVLFKPKDWASAVALCEGLNALKHSTLNFKVDGEVLNPEGAAVHWQELMTTRPQVLAKRNRSVELMDLAHYQLAFDNPLRSVA